MSLRAQFDAPSLAVCFGLTLAIITVFGQTARFDFVRWDDDTYVFENPAVTAGLTAESIAWAFTRAHMANWHPLTWLSHMADCQLYGLWPGGHHLTNVALHAATAVSLFLVLRQMTGLLWPSALAAALFAIHPLRAESVAWVAERKDVLSGLFFVLTLAAYVGYVRRPFSLARYLAVLTLFACGLMSKPMLVTLPCLLMVLDCWPLNRWTWPTAAEQANSPRKNFAWSRLIRDNRRVWAEKLPLFALVALACAGTMIAQRGAGAVNTHYPLATRLAGALVAYASYVGQFFVPVNLAAFYPHPGESLPHWKVGGAFATLLAISIVSIAARRKYPYLLVGWLWFLGMLTPVIGIVQVGSQAMADRYTYLPQIGLCFALAFGAADVARAWSLARSTKWIGTFALLLVLMIALGRQTSSWRNDETLWRHALASTANNWMAYFQLAATLNRQNKLDEAIAHWQIALEIRPAFEECHFQLGYALARQGKMSEAMAHYEQALALQPTGEDAMRAHAQLAFDFDRRDMLAEAIAHYEQALRINPNDTLLRYNLGFALDRQGETDAGMIQYQRSLELSPRGVTAANAHTNLGVAYDRQGKIAAAMEHYKQAVDLQPNNARAHNNLGVALDRHGDSAAALQQFQQAVSLQPNYAAAHCNLANGLARQGRFEVAIAHYRQALQIEPGMAAAQANLIDALAALGKSEAAIAECEQALALAETHGQSGLAALLSQKLRSLRSTPAAAQPR